MGEGKEALLVGLEPSLAEEVVQEFDHASVRYAPSLRNGDLAHVAEVIFISTQVAAIRSLWSSLAPDRGVRRARARSAYPP